MKITKLGCVLSVLALLAAPVVSFAIDVSLLPLESQAALGASHVVEFDFEDLTETDTNGTAQTTAIMAIPAKMGVEFVAAQLVTAFDTANTNYTGSTTITVGDGGDVDRFLPSMELASDGTEVWLDIDKLNTVYTVADTVDVVFTQSTNEGLADNTVGKILLYFRLWDAR